MTGYIYGMSSVESAYLLQTTPAISSFTHKDLPALMTTIAYLTQLEGPMWKRIRGKGLAYSYMITLKPNQGTLTLQLGRAAQLTEAYKEASKIINFFLNETKRWDRLLFESARSTLIFEIIEREAEIHDVIQQSLYAYHRKVTPEYNRSANFINAHGNNESDS
ncbi:hypothetical protein Avbf_09977 [Armadillidium vulgare]|nr:hypothetical protein Avbf_09977 [Armadillidium vulgare]